MPFESRLPVRPGRLSWAVLVAAGLAGCTLPTSAGTATAYEAPPLPLAADRGIVSMRGASRQADAACRSLAASGGGNRLRTAAEQRALARSDVVLAAEAGAGPVGTSSAPAPPTTPTPQAIYTRCMQSGHG